MGTAWERLQAYAKGTRLEAPTTPITAANDPNPTQTTPSSLSAAIDALTAPERAWCTPAILAALVAELPTCTDWNQWALTLRRDWVAARLGVAPTRFWHITRNGRRSFVEFVEPQTLTALQEQATRKQPGETPNPNPEPALLLPALRRNENEAVDNFSCKASEAVDNFSCKASEAVDNFSCKASEAVDKSVDETGNSIEVNTMEQNSLLPDNGMLSNNLTTSAPETRSVSAAELLQGAGVAVRYVADPAQLERALSELAALPRNGIPWGLDIETAPLPAFRKDSKAGLDPWRSAIRLVQVYAGGDTCYVMDIMAIGGLSALTELLNTRPWVAHNAVFEWKFLLHNGVHPTRLDCTLLQDNALGGGRRSLAVLVKERLNWDMDKALQVSDWTAANLTPAQLDYAALDAVAAYRLAEWQFRLLLRRNLGRCYQLMRDAQPAIAQLELNGCPFDTAAHSALIAQWQATAEQARGELDTLLNGANPDSPLQLSKWLAANLPADTLATWPKTATGQLSTDADTLAGLTLPALEPLARYKAATKGLSTYGKGYAAHISPVTGRIHASFLIGGAATGRFACTSPNIQNPPRDPAFRALFAPQAGRCFVVADYGQIELRVAALVSGDSAMLTAYEQGQDLHRKTAAAVLGIEPEQITKAQRQMAKAVNFGLLFGQGAKGLQAYAKASYGVEMSLEQAHKAKSAFFKAYPGLSAWQTQTRKAAEPVKQVRTPGGRCRELEKNIGTECLNTPIQGGAAECLLAALAELQLDSLKARLVNIVHDELVVECEPEQAGAVVQEVERAMTAGFLAIFPNGCTRDLVEAHYGANWASAKG